MSLKTAFLGLLLAPALAFASPTEETAWPLERVANGVFAALLPPAERFDDANSLIVVG